MAQFGGGTPATYTPVANTTDVNAWVLNVLTAGQLARVKMINWGGLGTSLVGYVTRWARVTNTPVTAVTRLGTAPAASSNPGTTPTARLDTFSGTSAQATADTYLFKQSWNVQGGGGVVVLPIGGEWQVVGGALGQTYQGIGCGNNNGADANLSNYGVQWEE
jgi:hypothetical protein